MVEMTVILRFWRDMPKEEKQEMKTKYEIRTITYSDIQLIYKSEKK